MSHLYCRAAFYHAQARKKSAVIAIFNIKASYNEYLLQSRHFYIKQVFTLKKNVPICR